MIPRRLADGVELHPAEMLKRSRLASCACYVAKNVCPTVVKNAG